MNSAYHLTVLQKIRRKQEEDLIRKVRMQQEKRKRQGILKRRKCVAVIILASFFVTFIYGANLLLNDKSKSYAIEASAPLEKKDIKVETKDIVVKAVSTKVESKVVAPTKVESKVVVPPSEASIFNKNIPMPIEHQEYLYEICQERGLDYRKTLAVIKHESVFDPNVVNETHDYGYFQVNLINHKDLSKTLQTDNSPLNPYINMNWGTYMLANLYSYWGEKGYKGESLDEAVWSSYNKGITGFKKYGLATAYISKMNEAIQVINHTF